ncbi:MAG: CocE/NonD family hydrolase C-terminal non-catalytic domain-containing protein [Hyphomicrobiales bacterium]
MTPGTFYRVRLKLNDCGHAFAPGHVVRLALSTAYWPLIWPSPGLTRWAVLSEEVGPMHYHRPFHKAQWSSQELRGHEARRRDARRYGVRRYGLGDPGRPPSWLRRRGC